MAAEWWYPPEDMRIRLPACGHAVFQRDFPRTYNKEESVSIKCPVCDLTQGLTSASKCRDGVPTDNLAWGDAQCRTRRDLNDSGPWEGQPGSLEGLLVAMSTPGVHRIDLEAAALKLGRQLQQEGPTRSLVLRAWPAGCTVTGGAVVMPDSAIVLLTGRGVCFQGTTFSGRGTLVCCGADFVGSFRDCDFTRCSLYAVHGASVTFRRCSLSAGDPGIVAHGPATCATLDTCTLDACMPAAIAERGATITKDRCTTRNCRMAVIARDVGTRASCMDSICLGMTLPGQPISSTGVQVRDAHVTLRRCSFERVVHGIHASGRAAAVELNGCMVHASKSAVTAVDRAAVMLRQSDVQLLKPDTPALSWVADASALSLLSVQGGPGGHRGGVGQIERCSLSTQGRSQAGVTANDSGMIAISLSDLNCAANCVTACSRGRVTAVAHCTLRSASAFACDAEGGSTFIRVVGGRAAGAQAGVLCAEGGTLTARGATLSGLAEARAAAKNAAGAQTGGVLRLSECTLCHAGHGVQVKRATASVHNVTISDLSGASADEGGMGYAQTGGLLTVKGGCVKGCIFGATAAALTGDRGEAHAHYDGVSFESNEMAIHVTWGASLTATGCSFTGARGPRRLRGQSKLANSLGQVGMYFTEEARKGVVKGCTFEGLDRDLHFYGERSVEVSDCTFRGSRGCCVLLQGRGAVRGCVFTDALCAVAVYSKGSAVSDCVVVSGVKQGVLVEDGGQVEISGCKLNASETAIEVKDSSTATVADSECVSEDIGVSMYGAAAVQAQRVVIEGGGTGVQVAAGKAAKATVSLNDCAISGGRMGGVMLKNVGADATLQGCEVKAGQAGVAVLPGAVARLSNTKVTQCPVGITVGAPEGMLGYPCQVCRRSGAAALVAAWGPLQAGGGTGMPGARCMHEGAYGAATLRDVDINECETGVEVRVTGRVDAERVQVRGAAASYSLTRIGALSRFEDCKASGGKAPSVSARRLLQPGSGQHFEMDEVPGITVVDEGAHAGMTAVVPDAEGATG